MWKKTILAQVAVVLFSAPVLSDELKEGFLIESKNLDQVLSQNFEGKPIKEMLPESVQRAIKEMDVAMILKRSEPLGARAGLKEATEKYCSQTSYDSKSKNISNFTTGMPFCAIHTDDPEAGYKLMLNLLRGPWIADFANIDPMVIFTVTKKGFEREMRGTMFRLMADGRLQQPHHIGNPENWKYEMMVFNYPNDARGVGMLTIQHMDASLPDVYAYIKPVRRVRRLSGGAWSDTVSGTDMFGDETFGFSGYPSWYKSFKILEKRTILASMKSLSNGPAWDKSGLQKFPVFNRPTPTGFTDQYEPHEVFTVEGIAPDYHTVSKKIFYISTNLYNPFIIQMETFDKKGDLLTLTLNSLKPVKEKNGGQVLIPAVAWIGNLQTQHLSAMVTDPAPDKFKLDPPELNPAEYMSPNSIQRFIK